MPQVYTTSFFCVHAVIKNMKRRTNLHLYRYIYHLVNIQENLLAILHF